jgi:hypothetical protein
MTDVAIQPVLFGMEQAAKTSDDYYTPAWVFERMGIEFDLDVCSPPGGLPWIPARRFFTMADDGLSQPWAGRVWMNPPYSQPSPWVDRFVAHGSGICLLPFAKSRWARHIWDSSDGVVLAADQTKFYVPGGDERTTAFEVFFAAFGEECVEAISRLGRVRR